MYVVLLDNGRTQLLADEVKRQALRCIRCGACLNACPVYKNVGGHTYETTYSGPIGSIISPHYLGMKEYKHLSYASSLCGACTSVCPVRIDIAEMLLLNRKESVDRGFFKPVEKLGFKIWAMAMKHRMMLNIGSGGMKAGAANTLFRSSWGKHRADMVLAPKNFNQLWRERRGTKD
jgi:L-lactate dehydrogenase complex protein LldF